MKRAKPSNKRRGHPLSNVTKKNDWCRKGGKKGRKRENITLFFQKSVKVALNPFLPVQHMIYSLSPKGRGVRSYKSTPLPHVNPQKRIFSLQCVACLCLLMVRCRVRTHTHKKREEVCPLMRLTESGYIIRLNQVRSRRKLLGHG